MSSTTGGARVRKACLQCIRAKSKCSPSEHRPDECHRCNRLNKQCTFEVIARKPGPGAKSRSRVRQLEQRVESLIGLIAAKNTDVPAASVSQSNVHQVVTPESSTEANTPMDFASTESFTSEPAPRPWLESAAFHAFDPIDAGLIAADHAYRLVEEFKRDFVWAFPFVVVDIDGPTLRHQEPFLLHAILTVTTYATPDIQFELSDKIRHEISRLVLCSRKSLGILQGLLIYGNWYHSFYHPVNQQITTIVHLCIAMVYDLGYTRNTPTKTVKCMVADSQAIPKSQSTKELPVTHHEKRALLGTYYLNVVFTQSWRQQPTLPYTRFMTQACDQFDASPIASDVLISPLIKTSELWSRANNHFSYTDLENADIRGENLLSMSTKGFLAELKHIKDFASLVPSLEENVTLSLMLLLVNVAITEVCLHSSLWTTSPLQKAVYRSPVRLKMLHHTMEAAASYLRTIIQAPQPVLFRLSLCSWCGWFYVFVVICKLVFLEENERAGQTGVDGMAREVENLIPEVDENAERTHSISGSVAHNAQVCDSSWNAVAVMKQYGLEQLTDQFTEKFKFSMASEFTPWQKSRPERNSLYPISCLHKTMLQGFTKRIERLTAVHVPDHTAGSTAAKTPLSDATGGLFTRAWQAPPTNSEDARRVLTLPFSNFMNFDSLNFDGVTLPPTDFAQLSEQAILGDVMWDMAMDDFTMPHL
ncbi:hypothetical protein ACEQ8H_005817 [Pleosporales sp. CAS-2024a]